MTPRQKRFALIGGVLLVLAAIAALVLNAFRSNMVFFYTPTQIAAGEAPKDRTFRLGGLVQAGSLRREGITAHFIVTDTARSVPVRFDGRAWWPRAPWARTGPSAPARCWPSTTRTTCPPKPPRP